jgi:hypothetical protein
MKGNIIILFFSLIFVPVFLQAQIQEPLLSAPPTEDPINGKIHYALTFNHTQQWNGSYTSIGGDAWIPFRQKFTLNYNLRFGLPPDGGIYVHASDGLFLGGLILGNFSEYKVLSTIGVIMLFIPEGVGYYIGKGRNKCHLSVNPLTIDYRYRNIPQGEWSNMGGNITARFHIPSKNAPDHFISPFIGLVANYHRLESFGIRAGISIGFHDQR